MEQKLTAKEITTRLNILGSVYGNDWKTYYVELREMYLSGRIKFTGFLKTPCPLFITPEEYLNRSSNWSTFQECIEYKITNDGDVTITCWDGDNMYGNRKSKRWSAKFTGFKKFSLLERDVRYKWKRHISDVHKLMKQQEREDELKKISDELLAQFN